MPRRSTPPSSNMCCAPGGKEYYSYTRRPRWLSLADTSGKGLGSRLGAVNQPPAWVQACGRDAAGKKRKIFFPVVFGLAQPVRASQALCTRTARPFPAVSNLSAGTVRGSSCVHLRRVTKPRQSCGCSPSCAHFRSCDCLRSRRRNSILPMTNYESCCRHWRNCRLNWRNRPNYLPRNVVRPGTCPAAEPLRRRGWSATQSTSTIRTEPRAGCPFMGYFVRHHTSSESCQRA